MAITIRGVGVWFSETILFIRNGWLCLCRCRILFVSSSIYSEAKLALTNLGMLLMQTSAIRSISRQLICRAKGVTCSSSQMLLSWLLTATAGFLSVLFIFHKWSSFVFISQYQVVKYVFLSFLSDISLDVFGKKVLVKSKTSVSHSLQNAIKKRLRTIKAPLTS